MINRDPLIDPQPGDAISNGTQLRTITRGLDNWQFVVYRVGLGGKAEWVIGIGTWRKWSVGAEVIRYAEDAQGSDR